MNKNFILTIFISLLLISVIYFIFETNTENSLNIENHSPKNPIESVIPSVQKIDDTQSLKIVTPEVRPSEVQQLAPVAKTSKLKEQLCLDVVSGCQARTDIDYSIVLSSDTGDLQADSAGILLQSKNFTDVYEKFANQDVSPESVESSSVLQKYLKSMLHKYPSSTSKVACSKSICMIEIDADGQENLDSLNNLVNSDDWPMGSSVIVPVYDKHRIKYRVVTARVHQPGSGVKSGGAIN
jgi:hypothetical protein